MKIFSQTFRDSAVFELVHFAATENRFPLPPLEYSTTLFLNTWSSRRVDPPPLLVGKFYRKNKCTDSLINSFVAEIYFRTYKLTLFTVIISVLFAMADKRLLSITIVKVQNFLFQTQISS